MEPWVDRLKQAYFAGYYQTEAAEDRQSRFPWQNKTCKDCPFWSSGICQVFAEYRRSTPTPVPISIHGTERQPGTRSCGGSDGPPPLDGSVVSLSENRLNSLAPAQG